MPSLHRGTGVSSATRLNACNVGKTIGENEQDCLSPTCVHGTDGSTLYAEQAAHCSQGEPDTVGGMSFHAVDEVHAVHKFPHIIHANSLIVTNDLESTEETISVAVVALQEHRAECEWCVSGDLISEHE